MEGEIGKLIEGEQERKGGEDDPTINKTRTGK
jgi:hypothetical protein